MDWSPADQLILALLASEMPTKYWWVEKLDYYGCYYKIVIESEDSELHSANFYFDWFGNPEPNKYW